ncbi:ferritin-like protein [Anseongella ginsenosidimutans]|uniref:Ferritin-like protein n=1 Tax=Anseongella ginsenosidimutans TaxID=496056 RepID=A0A4R3KLI6_9SPHI|nr:ferritin-like domain-containing protein [Anseongella ginsenosidimutans]QEC53799.1 ferritin-like domain-containing protein [Anseongella ginsenosidimutans]TCS84943.1 ferritin-like protein [Anseongella ginsenosidimutans]
MKALKIFDDISKDMRKKDLSRRDALREGLNFGLKSALMALPLALVELKSNKAYAQSGSGVIDVLNYALTLEYLEAEFYQKGLDSNGLISGDHRPVMQQISKHETAHVAVLTATIQDLGGTPVSKPTFDFTAGGTFADVFSNYETFLALSQAFEDTGVRAYKGQAGNLLGQEAITTAALNIHSVEARHASQVRILRMQKGWITGNSNSGLPAAIYAGEENIMQGGADMTSVTSVSEDRITEAFDEPLTMDQVLAIAGLFIK